MELVTKCIANRLKYVLPILIDNTQSAFVLGQLIIDNALISFEAFHYLKHKTKGKRGYMALKLDMSKAYDRMEWRFLYSVLRGMEFPISFINLIMRCVTSVSYLVIINGKV